MKKIIGLAAMALGFGAVTVSQQIAKVDSQNNVRSHQGNQNRESQPLTSQSPLKQKASKQYKRSSSTSFGYDPGIPPKVYGMHYVKRGTHKRSNV